MKEQSINYTKRIRVVGIVVDLNEEGKTIQLPASLLSLLPCQPCHRNSTLTVSNRSTPGPTTSWFGCYKLATRKENEISCSGTWL